MSLLGRTVCKEDRDCEVKVWLVGDDDFVKLSEQLNEEEANDFANKLITELETTKSKFIKVVKDRGDSRDKVFYLAVDKVAFIQVY